MKHLSLEDIKSDLAWLQEHGGNDIPLREIAERMEFLIPAADVAPVVHGRWNYDGSCGVCGVHILSNMVDYCPNCGAKMDL